MTIHRQLPLELVECALIEAAPQQFPLRWIELLLAEAAPLLFGQWLVGLRPPALYLPKQQGDSLLSAGTAKTYTFNRNHMECTFIKNPPIVFQ